MCNVVKVENCSKTTYLKSPSFFCFVLRFASAMLHNASIAPANSFKSAMKLTYMLQPSLRQKITLGYYVVAFLILGVSLFTFEELRLVEEKIYLGERISEIFDSAMEIRRFERNYFLHNQAADYQENVRYVTKLRMLLGKDKADFELLEAPQRILILSGALERYDALMQQYVRTITAPPTQRAALEQRVREAGKAIVALAEEMVTSERRLVRSSLATFTKILVFSIIGLALLIIAVGQALSRRVVQPLLQIERSVEAISSGKRDKLSVTSQDREIVSISAAFNHMLHELELRQKHLLRSEKLASLGTMLSGVAHELNNPLSNIWSSCQILLEEIDDADIEVQKALLLQIDEQSVRARNIVRSLLDFARDKQFNKEPLSLHTLIQQTLRFIKGEVPATVTLTIDVAEDLVLLADKQRLQQVFLNLIKNALQAIGAQGEIVIRAKRYSPTPNAEQPTAFFSGCRVESDAVDITIKDSGPGIAPEVLPRIFDPFFTTKDVGKGMGLGLFIVYQVIDEHEGCIAASSELGKGTTFLIRLPLGKS